MVTITVKGTNWGMGRPEDIKSLLENVAEHLTRHFREGVHATIEVENSPLVQEPCFGYRGKPPTRSC